MCGHEELLSHIREYKVVSEMKTYIMEAFEVAFEQTRTLMNTVLENFNERIKTSCQSNERAPAA